MIILFQLLTGCWGGGGAGAAAEARGREPQRGGGAGPEAGGGPRHHRHLQVPRLPRHDAAQDGREQRRGGHQGYISAI